MKIDNEYTDELVCPHCGYQMSDSWEYNENWSYTCPNCDEDFEFDRNVEVTYTTYKKACKEEDHKYIFTKEWILNKKYNKGGDWGDLPLEEHKKYNIYECAICNHTKLEEL